MRPILYLIKTPDKKRVDRYRISFLKHEDIEEIYVCIWERKFKTQTRSHPLSAIDLIDSGYHGIHDGGNNRPASILKVIKVTEGAHSLAPTTMMSMIIYNDYL